jgi:hypothetical protein
MESEYFSIYKTAALVYFSCNNQMNDFLSRMEQECGKIEKPKITIAPEIGHLCFHLYRRKQRRSKAKAEFYSITI